MFIHDLQQLAKMPPLIEGDINGCEWLGFNTIEELCAPCLAQSEANISAFMQPIFGDMQQSRLGHYYELLWRCILHFNPNYDIIHNNLQIHQHNTTLGEMDFIVYNRALERYEHWELALKFFLGAGDTQQLNHWFGPNLKDRLDIKFEHIKNKQSQLSLHPASIAQLEKQSIPITHRRVLIQGKLFHPSNIDTFNKPLSANIHPQINPEHAHGQWITQDDFAHRPHDTHYYVLNRHLWLSGANHFSSAIQHSTQCQEKQLCNAKLQEPIQLLAHNTPIQSAFFLTPNDWQSSALQQHTNA